LAQDGESVEELGAPDGPRGLTPLQLPQNKPGQANDARETGALFLLGYDALTNKVHDDFGKQAKGLGNQLTAQAATLLEQ
jgi:hypothetical protein